MSSTGSVTSWIERLKAGEEAALAKLFARYQPVILGLARKKLNGAPLREADTDDIVQEVFWGFYHSLKRGQLPLLKNRNHLIALLTVITARKVARQIEREYRLIRGGGNIQDECVLDEQISSSDLGRGIEQVAGSEPRPEELAILRDLYCYCIDLLSPELREVAELYLAGCTLQEVSDHLALRHGFSGWSLRSVERKVANILRRWQKLAEESVARLE